MCVEQDANDVQTGVQVRGTYMPRPLQSPSVVSLPTALLFGALASILLFVQRSWLLANIERTKLARRLFDSACLKRSHVSTRQLATLMPSLWEDMPAYR